MADIDKLRAEYERAEAKAHALQAEKDEAAQKVREKYRDRQRDANADAAEAQKALCDAEAAQALADRDDLDDDGKIALAGALNLTLPE
jgi:hypothetical protein